MSSLYLDHNATTPMLPEVAAAMAECYSTGLANPASLHHAGRRARQRLEQAREDVARMLGADLGGQRTSDHLIFTSGGTEANNLAVSGFASAAETTRAPPHEAVISSIEHPSVAQPAGQLERRGWRVHRLRVNRDGIVNVDHFRELLNERTRFVSVMLGNNETGVLQPVREMAVLCRDARIAMHTDAAQVAGKLPLDFRNLAVHAMTVAAHKFHGPVGIGALLVRHDVQIEPQLLGGFQQTGLRPGTESVAMAVGIQAALGEWERHAATRAEGMRRLRDQLEAAILAGYPRLVVNGRNAQRLPGTSNLAFVGLDRQQLFLALDLAGVCCSTGSACASGSSESSPVLRAMGLPPEVVHSSLRFSLGATTTEAEIDESVQRILEVCHKMAGSRATA